MNYLNGGYAMINSKSSTLQADLKKAYETGRPVLYYDGVHSHFVNVEKMGNKYFAFDGSYDHILEITGTNGNNKEFMIMIHCQIRNYKDIEYSDLDNLSFRVVSDDQTYIGDNSGETIYGELIGYGGFIAIAGTSDVVKYYEINIADATNVSIN